MLVQSPHRRKHACDRVDTADRQILVDMRQDYESLLRSIDKSYQAIADTREALMRANRLLRHARDNPLD